MSSRVLSVDVRRWRLRKPFRISRGEKTHAVVVELGIEQDGAVGRGEGVPYARYGESVEGTVELIASYAEAIEGGMGRDELNEKLEAGAARNALDCALWDLESKLTGQPVWSLAGLAEPHPRVTAFTLCVDTPTEMHRAAEAQQQRPLLKLKLAGDGQDLARIQAVHQAAPDASLWLDANEGLNLEACQVLAPHLAELGVKVFEQPLPASLDDRIADLECTVPLCADESFRGGVACIEQLAAGYQLVNVKLDKAGGLTEALRVMQAAQACGLGVVIGCMCSSSLSIAPAILLAQDALYADLDAALLLADDHEGGIGYDGARVHPAPRELWG